MENFSKISGNDVDELRGTLKEIGVARFVGRINAGLIDYETGFLTVREFVASEKERPLLSRVAQFVTGRNDVYEES